MMRRGKSLAKKESKKAFEIQDELASKNNWDKYSAQKPFEKLMRLLKCGEEAAKKAGEEFGVEVIHWVPCTPYEYNHFYSIFEPKGMSREQKFEEVKKRIDAVCRAGAIYYGSKPKYRKKSIWLVRKGDMFKSGFKAR